MIAIGAQLSEQIALSYIRFNYLSFISSSGYHSGVLKTPCHARCYHNEKNPVIRALVGV